MLPLPLLRLLPLLLPLLLLLPPLLLLLLPLSLVPWTLPLVPLLTLPRLVLTLPPLALPTLPRPPLTLPKLLSSLLSNSGFRASRPSMKKAALGRLFSCLHPRALRLRVRDVTHFKSSASS